MILDAYVTRPEVGGGNLDLINDTYQVEGESGIEFGQRSWRREMVNSPFVHGSYPTTQVQENGQLNVSIRVKTADPSALTSAIAALVAAFSQFEYEFHVTINGIERAWTCYSADIVVDAQDERMDQNNIVVRLGVPRSPLQLASGGL